MQESQKLSKFLDAIHNEAQRRQNNITKETEDFKKAELKKIKHEALKEAGAIIRSEEEKLRSDIGRKISAVKVQNRNKLIDQRNNLVEEISKDVCQKIIAFTEKNEYTEKVKSDIESVKSELEEPLIVKAKPGDKAVEQCKNLFPENTAFEEDSEIKLGGIIIVSEKKKMIFDFTFDAMIESEMEKFREESGLKLSY